MRAELAPVAEPARARRPHRLAADPVDHAGGGLPQRLALLRGARGGPHLVGHHIVPDEPDLDVLADPLPHAELVEAELAVAVELVLRRYAAARLEVVDLEAAVPPLGPAGDGVAQRLGGFLSA